MWPFGRPRRDPEAPETGPGRAAAVGRRGEDLARRHLRRLGMKLLARNYRCPAGEIDLIALDRSTRRATGAETLAFVEVKTRSSDEHTSPAGAVDASKRRRLERLADHYLATHDADGLSVRFDIVSIVLRPGRKAEIEYLPDAF